MKVKIFTEIEVQNLEKDINEWMRKNEIEIFKILQSQSEDNDSRNITISIFYRNAE